MELAEEEVVRRESAGEANEVGWRSGWHRGVQVDTLGLTGGVAVDIAATGRPRIDRPATNETESLDSVAVGSD